MRKINTNNLEEYHWSSPKGKFAGSGREISEALGADPRAAESKDRHPFAVEILRIPSGRSPYPYHSHSAQWEFYHVISGNGAVRHSAGSTPIVAGDAFIFEPGQAHQLTNDGTEDLVIYVIADNPVGESAYFPDSDKWLVYSPQRRLIRSAGLEYYDGEE